MIRQLETQDQNGNKIYRHTSSDIVWNLDTGHTVKEDIDTLMAALGITDGAGGSMPEVNIDANTLSGHTIEELVLNDTYRNAITELNNAIAGKAPLASPAFTGTPTVPDVEQKDGTAKVANTNYVDTAAAGVKDDIVEILKGYAAKEHSHSASDITSGTFANTAVYAKNGSDYTESRIRNISFLGSSEELPAALENGAMLAVYEG